MRYAIVKILAYTEDVENLRHVEDFPAIKISKEDLKENIKKQEKLKLKYLNKQQDLNNG